jgi:fructose-1,6-bisphosphatase/inositol monophosphatase family enzyme
MTATARHYRVVAMTPASTPDLQATVHLIDQVIDAIGRRLEEVDTAALTGIRPGQYVADLHANDLAVTRFVEAGFAVLSEETGLHHRERRLTVIVDPLDGSTNASRRIPWYATAVCVVDEVGPWIAVVGDHASGRRYRAVRGGGATVDGRPLIPSDVEHLDAAIVGLSGLPPHHLGWQQFRALGAVALDLCLVAGGELDGFVDCSVDAHGVWDYAASVLICAEVGVQVVDAWGRDLVVLDPSARRTPVAGATPALLDSLVAARRGFTQP